MNKKTSTLNKALVYVMQLKKDVSIRNNEDVFWRVYYAGLILEQVTHGSNSRGCIFLDRLLGPFGYECALHGFWPLFTGGWSDAVSLRKVLEMRIVSSLWWGRNVAKVICLWRIPLALSLSCAFPLVCPLWFKRSIVTFGMNNW
uniref:hypothetical protein n=1 Tax=Pseudomonas monteilii TaxID=76759 RepID=UPI0015EFB881|nr:hypothetical protein [Pseudomonas monteilii]